ncbi:hypothetical protein EON64_17260 [archaeon]|nr:MAG: hypothetical protein EON64_17260 [archaeon]
MGSIRGGPSELIYAEYNVLWIFVALCSQLIASEVTWRHLPSTFSLFSGNTSHRLADWCVLNSLLPVVLSSLAGQRFALQDIVVQTIGLTWGSCGLLWKCACLDSISTVASHKLLCLILLGKLVDFLLWAGVLASGNVMFAVFWTRAIFLIFAAYSFQLQCSISIAAGGADHSVFRRLSFTKCAVCFAFCLILAADSFFVLMPEHGLSVVSCDAVTSMHLLAIVSSIACSNFSLLTAVDASRRISSLVVGQDRD